MPAGVSWRACRRGKQDQKHFTVFVADVDPAVAQQLAPQLSNESREWRWVPWADVLAAVAGKNDALQLHPVVDVLADKHADAVHSSTQACTATDQD